MLNWIRKKKALLAIATCTLLTVASPKLLANEEAPATTLHQETTIPTDPLALTTLDDGPSTVCLFVDGHCAIEMLVPEAQQPELKRTTEEQMFAFEVDYYDNPTDQISIYPSLDDDGEIVLKGSFSNFEQLPLTRVSKVDAAQHGLTTPARARDIANQLERELRIGYQVRRGFELFKQGFYSVIMALLATLNGWILWNVLRNKPMFGTYTRMVNQRVAKAKHRVQLLLRSPVQESTSRETVATVRDRVDVSEGVVTQWTVLLALTVSFALLGYACLWFNPFLRVQILSYAVVLQFARKLLTPVLVFVVTWFIFGRIKHLILERMAAGKRKDSRLENRIETIRGPLNMLTIVIAFVGLGVSIIDVRLLFALPFVPLVIGGVMRAVLGGGMMKGINMIRLDLACIGDDVELVLGSDHSYRVRGKILALNLGRVTLELEDGEPMEVENGRVQEIVNFTKGTFPTEELRFPFNLTDIPIEDAETILANALSGAKQSDELKDILSVMGTPRPLIRVEQIDMTGERSYLLVAEVPMKQRDGQALRQGVNRRVLQQLQEYLKNR